MVGDGYVEAIGADEGDDGEEEKEDCRESLHGDRSCKLNWFRIERNLSRCRRGCGFGLTSKTSVRTVQSKASTDNEGEKQLLMLDGSDGESESAGCTHQLQRRKFETALGQMQGIRGDTHQRKPFYLCWACDHCSSARQAMLPPRNGIILQAALFEVAC
jgi:hypothetical protein